MLGILNHTEITNVLSSQVLGRIACCKKGKPYLVPVTYVYDGKNIYGQSLEGKKLDILRKHPKVCFEVDMMTDMQNWKSVLVYGKFRELNGEDEKKARKILFSKVLTLMTSSTIHPYGHETNGKVDNENRIKPVMYRIDIDKVTGRFEKN
ncbi:MAG: pyridoxamine 5'-phosphate oxidase family protein [Terrimonas sp.]|nr:pyridoxamine 5'-phosphate oxidase family protein [Terrimonas sp.]